MAGTGKAQLDENGKGRLDGDGKLIINGADDSDCCCDDCLSAAQVTVAFAGMTVCTSCFTHVAPVFVWRSSQWRGDPNQTFCLPHVSQNFCDHYARFDNVVVEEYYYPTGCTNCGGHAREIEISLSYLGGDQYRLRMSAFLQVDSGNYRAYPVFYATFDRNGLTVVSGIANEVVACDTLDNTVAAYGGTAEVDFAPSPCPSWSDPGAGCVEPEAWNGAECVDCTGLIDPGDPDDPDDDTEPGEEPPGGQPPSGSPCPRGYYRDAFGNCIRMGPGYCPTGTSWNPVTRRCEAPRPPYEPPTDPDPSTAHNLLKKCEDGTVTTKTVPKTYGLAGRIILASDNECYTVLTLGTNTADTQTISKVFDTCVGCENWKAFLRLKKCSSSVASNYYIRAYTYILGGQPVLVNNADGLCYEIVDATRYDPLPDGGTEIVVSAKKDSCNECLYHRLRLCSDDSLTTKVVLRSTWLLDESNPVLEESDVCYYVDESDAQLDDITGYTALTIDARHPNCAGCECASCTGCTETYAVRFKNITIDPGLGNWVNDEDTGEPGRGSWRVSSLGTLLTQSHCLDTVVADIHSTTIAASAAWADGWNGGGTVVTASDLTIEYDAGTLMLRAYFDIGDALDRILVYEADVSGGGWTANGLITTGGADPFQSADGVASEDGSACLQECV